MKTSAPAPHFLRVTQALALVSGLGLPLFGCGGREECTESACEDALASDGTIANDSPSGGDAGAAGDGGIGEGFGAAGDAAPGGDAGAAGDAGLSDGPSGESGDATLGDARDATIDASPLDPPEMPA